jgi:DNA invertase Pin-like site-specific DNA recombinase
MISPSIQRDEITRYADAHGFTITEFFEDLDITGRTDARPGLQALLAAAGDVDAVIVYRLDRFTREPLHYYQMVHALTAAGVALHDAGESRHEDTPETDFMRGIKILIAKQESRNIGRRAEATHRRLAKVGRWGGGTVPFGWRRVRDDTGPRLEVDPEEAALRRWMHERLWMGWSCYRIARTLNEQGHRNRRGGAWTNSIVRAVLSSPIQVGARDVAGELVTGGNIAAILTPAELSRSIALLPPRTRRAGRPSPVSLPTHVLRCGTCGSVLAISHIRGHVYFVCAGRRIGTCTQGVAIDAADAAAEVERLVLRRLKGLRPRKRTTTGPAYDKMQAVQVEIARARDTLAKLHLMRADGLMEAREYEDAIALQRARLGHLEQRLTRAEEKVEGEAREAVLARMAEDLGNIGPHWHTLSVEERRDIVRLLVREVVVAPGRAAIGERLRVSWH